MPSFQVLIRNHFARDKRLLSTARCVGVFLAFLPHSRGESRLALVARLLGGIKARRTRLLRSCLRFEGSQIWLFCIITLTEGSISSRSASESWHLWRLAEMFETIPQPPWILTCVRRTDRGGGFGVSNRAPQSHTHALKPQSNQAPKINSSHPFKAPLMLRAMIHRYHRPYYEMVAVFYWPVLFFQLWRIDRWSQRTGRRAFVEPDRYGRAWVVWWEGMSRYGNVLGLDVQVWSPQDVADYCSGRLEIALLSPADACAGRHPWTETPLCSDFTDVPWIPACAGIAGHVHLEPG